jgi:chemotaxis protein methyltransferase CheR
MAFYSESLALPENAFLILRDLIKERTGIWYEESKRDILADKLSNRVLEKGFTSFIDYYYLLKYDSDALQEWNVVLDLITVNETYFWREYDHIEALLTFILPEYLKENNGKPFKIWCAACSTGEEPLSILMALDMNGWLGKIPIEIVASDASTQALTKAKEGLFRERSFRSLPGEIRDRYFTSENNLWRIEQRLHSKIRWKQINLLNEQEISFAGYTNLIFCRNVFIYFKDDTIKSVIENFHSQLTSDGYLIVGVSESLFKLSGKFQLTELGKTFVYKKI